MEQSIRHTLYDWVLLYVFHQGITDLNIMSVKSVVFLAANKMYITGTHKHSIKQMHQKHSLVMQILNCSDNV